MAGGAAGGFVTRAFESMLKECSPKKHADLQKAIQAYIGFILTSSVYNCTYIDIHYVSNFGRSRIQISLELVFVGFLVFEVWMYYLKLDEIKQLFGLTYDSMMYDNVGKCELKIEFVLFM